MIRICIYNLLFFLILYYLRFSSIDIFKEVICVIAVIVISFFNVIYLGSQQSIWKGFGRLLFVIWILSELADLLSYYLGLLPRYMDAPLFISIFLRIVLISIYLLVLVGVTRGIKKN